MLFFTHKLVVHVLACTQAITHIKWRRLDFVAILTSHNSPTPISLVLLAQLQAYNDFTKNQILKVICSVIALIKNLKFLQFCYLGWQVLILKSLNCATKKIWLSNFQNLLISMSYNHSRNLKEFKIFDMTPVGWTAQGFWDLKTRFGQTEPKSLIKP